MIVHKRTLYCVNSIWTGEYVFDRLLYRSVPNYMPVYVEDLPESERNEYWNVPNKSALATKIMNYYPDFIPVEDDNGNLINIIPISDKPVEEDSPEPKKPKAYSKVEITLPNGTKVNRYQREKLPRRLNFQAKEKIRK